VSLPYQLRPASADDLEDLYQLAKRTMRPYVEQTWGSWDEEYQRNRFVQGPPAELHQMVVAAGCSIGCICLRDVGDELRLDRMYIDPAFQNQGIGTAILVGIISAATERAVPIRLRVLKVNPARALYERLGFRVTLEGSYDYLMEYAA